MTITTVKVTGRDGDERAIEVSEDQTLMEAIRDAGFDELLALCGGSCACATCHVFVDPEFLAELDQMSDDENDLLDSSEYRQSNSRLSCQIRLREVLEGLRVTIAPGD